jgi:hypothetical protein
MDENSCDSIMVCDDDELKFHLHKDTEINCRGGGFKLMTTDPFNLDSLDTKDVMMHSTLQKEARIRPRFARKNAVDSKKKALCPPQEKNREFRTGL